MYIRALSTSVFKKGEPLDAFVIRHVKNVSEGSVVVITSKIVALAEGRVSSKALKERIILRESTAAMPTKYAWLTITDGMLMPSAGIDESNANGKIILLPKNSFRSAEKIRRILMKKFKIRKLGVLITDSRVYPLRAGVIGVALGYAGFRGVKDYRGLKDIFNRTLKITRVNVADSLATSAVLLMGEGSERRPLAIIHDAPVVFSNKVHRRELMIPPADDLYAPLLVEMMQYRNRKRI